jgi:thiamine-monophosphate kinase
VNKFFAPGTEFSLIEKMFGDDRFRRDGRGLGDDTFLFEPKPGVLWAVTSDASSEGVHYRLDWATPEKALRKALLANLSDINAMGGRSRHAFLNLGARSEWESVTFEKLGAVLRELEKERRFEVSGGDTIRTTDTSFFSFTVLGEVEGLPLLRSNCQPDHRVYVSGYLGGSAAGLRLLQKGERGVLTDLHLSPEPPLELGPFLGGLNKQVAAIDISDGLSSELWHLSRQSRCGLRVDWEKLPVHPELGTWDNKKEARDFVLNGGEEYQLLFSGDFSSDELSRMRMITPVAEIGIVEKGEGVFLTENGKTSPLTAGGFSH